MAFVLYSKMSRKETTMIFPLIYLILIIGGFLIFSQGATWIALGMMLASSFLFTRTLLVAFGWLKGPVLQNFEKYGEDENPYYILPYLLLWGGSFTLMSSIWISDTLHFWFAGELLGFAIMLVAWTAFRGAGYVQRHPNEWIFYPHWLYELQERTTRLERRRIAYMWLRLPWRMRLSLNGSDRAFSHWADMIIMSTLM
jgi:hypothetical protein